MAFSFYPNHEFACPQLCHCPHLGGAALGALVLLANESDDSRGWLHRQLDAARKTVSELVAANEQLKREIERLKLELKLERQTKFATNRRVRPADPILRPMLRSQRGRKGGAPWPTQRVTAAESSTGADT